MGGNLKMMNLEIRGINYSIDLENNEVFYNGNSKRKLEDQEEINHIIEIGNEVQSFREKYKGKKLKELIENMMGEFREKDSFSKSNMDQLLHLADYTENDVSRLINKFHYINTQIASNGGFPVLKQIYTMI
jgi:uncharacterized protein (DUF3820 family)